MSRLERRAYRGEHRPFVHPAYRGWHLSTGCKCPLRSWWPSHKQESVCTHMQSLADIHQRQPRTTPRPSFVMMVDFSDRDSHRAYPATLDYIQPCVYASEGPFGPAPGSSAAAPLLPAHMGRYTTLVLAVSMLVVGSINTIAYKVADWQYARAPTPGSSVGGHQHHHYPMIMPSPPALPPSPPPEPGANSSTRCPGLCHVRELCCLVRHAVALHRYHRRRRVQLLHLPPGADMTATSLYSSGCR